MPSSPANEGNERAFGQEAPQTQPNAVREDGSAVTEVQRDWAAELAEMEDRQKRALADLDNYRKRSAREVERRVAESQEALLRDWLEAVDSVERALRIGPQDPMFEGMRAVLEQMEAILARYGVERIGAAGELFDPERHDAIAVRSTSAVPDRTVLEVARSGFARGDQVLRPAQVIVSRPEDRAG
jgi:molecular chaperone GrpE